MKRAQITLFIIIGMVIIMIVGVSIYLLNFVSEQRLERTRQDTIERAQGKEVSTEAPSPLPHPKTPTTQKTVSSDIISSATPEPVPSNREPTASTSSPADTSAPTTPVVRASTPSVDLCKNHIKDETEQAIDCGGHCPECLCSDNTKPGACSTGRPKYCTSDLRLTNKCVTCGCPSGQECMDDGSCATIEYYFIFVPVGSWPSQDEFDDALHYRTLFFKEISPLKEKGVKNLYMPLKFADEQCSVDFTDTQDANRHMDVKRCADRYASSLGLSYERAVGFVNAYAGGYAYMGNKVVIATLGHANQDRVGIVAHELGHTYGLCDEYDYTAYTLEGGTRCPNSWPAHCNTDNKKCSGNTPVYQTYNGKPIDGVCKGKIDTSVMGWSVGHECGYDITGGYDKLARDFQ